jgi:hypothetical protein
LLTSEFTADDTGDANKAILLSTPKQTLLSKVESSKIVKTEITKTILYLSPTTRKLHDSLEKASINTQPLYTTKSLRETRNNLFSQ